MVFMGVEYLRFKSFRSDEPRLESASVICFFSALGRFYSGYFSSSSRSSEFSPEL